MKKLIITLLSVFLLFVAVSAAAFTVFAKENDPVSQVLSKLPDNAFQGEYKESRAKDGSVTRVFNNGGVLTRHADGTSTSVDQNGNQYNIDKDGSYTIRTTDGYKYTSYKDGREALTEPKGMTTTYNPDGSYSETIPNGMVTDYDANGNVTGAGVVGSSDRIGVDENGIIKNGEIKGPNGVELIVTEQGVHVVNEKGDVFDYNTADGTETVKIRYADGTKVDQSITETESNERGSCIIVESDGTRWEGNVFSGVDENGVPQNTDTMRWVGADGRSIWVDNNSKAIAYKDDNGKIQQFVVDENGKLVDLSGAGYDWKVSYDENGNIKNANITFPDATKLAQNPDGSIVIAPSDGTKYESDGKGNVTKNGEPIKEDGEWLSDDDGTDTQTDPPDEPESTRISAKEAAGTYHVSGTVYWHGEDGDESYPQSITMIVSANGEHSLTFTSDGDSFSGAYDPETGSGSLSEDGGTMSYRFERSGNTVKLILTLKFTDIDGSGSGTFSGTKG